MPKAQMFNLCLQTMKLTMKSVLCMIMILACNAHCASTHDAWGHNSLDRKYECMFAREKLVGSKFELVMPENELYNGKRQDAIRKYMARPEGSKFELVNQLEMPENELHNRKRQDAIHTTRSPEVASGCGEAANSIIRNTMFIATNCR